MTVSEAIDLLDEYSKNSEEFNPSGMIFGLTQADLTRQVFFSGVISSHINPSVPIEQIILDAIVHGICIGGLMVMKS